MKRSEINRNIEYARNVWAEHGWQLPPFASYAPADWQGREEEKAQLAARMLGWDLTDFGSGDFYKTGLLLFTLRNGRLDGQDEQPYAEKLMLVRENQVTPCHFHWSKMEDIINRGGGVLCVKLYESTEDEQLSDRDVRVMIDGSFRTYPAGSIVRIEPGSSITMHRGLYHSFWGEEGKGDVVVGEVSKVNDDTRDNRFLEPCGRFPAIEEDEAPIALLCGEY